MTPLGVAIAGSGIISNVHTSAILRQPRLRIAAVVDPNAEANARLAARIATETGAAPPAYEDLTQALAAGGIDVVVVCSPSGTHAELATQALQSGHHVVIEKPADATLPAARALAALAEKAQTTGQVCTVISQHRFDPASRAVAQAIVDGRFGRLTSALASVAWWRGQDYYDSADWRGTWTLDGGGATMNQGIHTVDLMLWLLGTPVEVSAQARRLAHDRIEVEDVAAATIRFASGALGVVHATTAAYPGLSVRLQVHGTRGSAIIHDDQLEYFHVAEPAGPAGGPDGATRGAVPAGIEPANQAADVVPAADVRGAPKPADAFVTGHWRQYVDIVEAIDTGRPPAVQVGDALTAIAVVRAMYVSATLGRPIAVDDVLAGDFDDQPATVAGPDTVEG